MTEWIKRIAVCNSCGYVWRGVIPDSKPDGLECPTCRAMDGVVYVPLAGSAPMKAEMEKREREAFEAARKTVGYEGNVWRYSSVEDYLVHKSGVEKEKMG